MKRLGVVLALALLAAVSAQAQVRERMGGYFGLVQESNEASASSVYVQNMGADFTPTYSNACGQGTNDGITCTANSDCTGGGICVTNGQVSWALASTVRRAGDTIVLSELPAEVVREDANNVAQSGVVLDWGAGNIEIENGTTCTLANAGEVCLDTDYTAATSTAFSLPSTFQWRDASATRKATNLQMLTGGIKATVPTTLRYYPVNTWLTAEPGTAYTAFGSASAAGTFVGSPAPMALTIVDVCCAISTAAGSGKTFNASVYYSTSARTVFTSTTSLVAIAGTTDKYGCVQTNTNLGADEVMAFGFVQTSAGAATDPTCTVTWVPQ